ncbi:hypothetical protein MNV49_003622 [Pseudohyphozyma bogoriensis]|nr:hypothetical protein MNV49_003622 [Pseudohyphozyma bogoriensis]
MVRKAAYIVALAVSITTFALSIASLVQPNWITFRTPSSSPIVLRSSYGLFQVCSSSHISWSPGKDKGEGSVTCRKFPTKSQDCSGGVTGRSAFNEAHELVFGTSSAFGIEGKRFRVGRAAADSVQAKEARRRLGQKKPASDGDDDDDDDEEVWTFCDSWITAAYATQLSLVFGSTAILANIIITLSGRQKRETGWRLVAGLMFLHAACLIVAMALVAREFNHDSRFYTGSRLDTSFIMATTAWSLDVVAVVVLALFGAIGFLREDDYRSIPDH